MLDIRRAVGGYKSSTKIDALIRHLKQYIQEGHRTVVFSQYTGFLDMIQVALKLHVISYVRFDGTLSQAQREKVLAKFGAKNTGGEDDRPPMVMLISLRAGGVGLNLTCASRAVMMVSVSLDFLFYLLILTRPFHRIPGGTLQWKHRLSIVYIAWDNWIM